MASMRAGARGGMQVHAVPETERAFDSAGRQLPWAYEYADSELNARRLPEEKGPFGKSMRRRGTSRSKTYTPARKEDQARIDNSKTIDDIFGSFKAGLKSEEAGAAAAAALNAQMGALSNPVPVTAQAAAKEPTEVILYGFGKDFQWSAIEFYERISNGIIYEDYERHPPHQKYNLSISHSRASSLGSLSQAALRKKNQYIGGDHWIKVTFDSPETAEAACYYSPHNLNGYAVYAEPYRGTGPKGDVPISAASINTNSIQTSPTARSSTTLQNQTASPSSATASSTTATASAPATLHGQPHPLSQLFTPSSSSPPAELPAASASTSALLAQPGRNTLRVRGARPAVLKPAEEALLPVVPRWQQAFSGIPILGLLFGGNNAIIGNQVPRKEDGSFDGDNASFYWKAWYFFDSMYATDFCGLEGDED